MIFFILSPDVLSIDPTKGSRAIRLDEFPSLEWVRTNDAKLATRSAKSSQNS